MTAVNYSEGSGQLGVPSPLSAEEMRQDQASRRWRGLWRIHFYSGIFAIPFILLMSITGLAILYDQPLKDATWSDLRTVAAGTETAPFAAQEQAVEVAYPGVAVQSMTVPRDAATATQFGLEDGRTAYVNPYTGVVLGRNNPSDSVWGVLRRLHGQLNNDWSVKLPAVAALWDHGAVMRSYVVGDMVLEVFGCWALVLVASGLYLWWPRRSRSRGTNGRSLFGVRLKKAGRARWRDLHAVPGVAVLALILITLVSGMPWSSYWGSNFTSLANKISPNVWTDAPASTPVTRGDLDRNGNTIHWNTGDVAVPASLGLPDDGSVPRPISLDDVVKIGAEEGMKPGYTVYFPSNSTDDVGNPVYGSYDLSNSWPRKTGEARDVFLDQFTGKTLGEMNAYGYGKVSYAADTTVSFHMGTQWGLVNRIFMTALCGVAIWSCISASVMYLKRRRPGTVGLPRRPASVKLGMGLVVITVAVAIVYPLWGATALVILAVDRYAIRKVGRLRRIFGQR